jgi:hypothetical protein
MRCLICLTILLCSCSSYRKNFDCPPGCGIPCTSVSTLEKMIVESPCGQDVFLGCIPKLVDTQTAPVCRYADSIETPAPFQRRIWIAPKEEERASYIYFEETFQCEGQ